MKLIVVLSIAEYQERVARLLHEAGIVRFSTVNITGYKKGKERASLNWSEEEPGSQDQFAHALQFRSRRDCQRCDPPHRALQCGMWRFISRSWIRVGSRKLFKIHII